MSEEINTPDYWDGVYSAEGEVTWRLYPETALTVRALLPPQQRIIEFGGGPGVLALALQKDGHNVAMIEQSQKAVAMARRAGVSCAIVGRVPENLPDCLTCDYVIACEFLEHFDEPRRIVAAAARIAPNAVFVVPNEVLGDHPEHSQEFSRDSLMELLTPFYKQIEIFEIVDEWTFKPQGIIDREQTIRIPLLVAHCRGTQDKVRR